MNKVVSLHLIYTLLMKLKIKRKKDHSYNKMGEISIDRDVGSKEMPVAENLVEREISCILKAIVSKTGITG